MEGCLCIDEIFPNKIEKDLKNIFRIGDTFYAKVREIDIQKFKI